jgi:hypothetical protein
MSRRSTLQSPVGRAVLVRRTRGDGLNIDNNAAIRRLYGAMD